MTTAGARLVLLVVGVQGAFRSCPASCAIVPVLETIDRQITPVIRTKHNEANQMPITLPSLPSWSATKTSSKQGLDKVHDLVDKLGQPINNATSQLSTGPFRRRTLDETDKAARVSEPAASTPEAPPGDGNDERPGTLSGFGLPAESDPDPFGVKALQKEGFEIKEAGSKRRPSMEAFEYKPSPTSPIYSTFRRHSLDGARRNSKRSSIRSVASVDRGTQTDDLAMSPTIDKQSSPTVKTPEEIKEDIDGEKDQQTMQAGHLNAIDTIPEAPAPVITKARLVTIPKRQPPTLPPRNPYRNPSLTKSMESDGLPGPAQGASGVDVYSNSHSPDRDITPPSATAADPTTQEHEIEGALSNTHLSLHLLETTRRTSQVSLSGSEYSRDAPITMQDNEPDDSTTNKAADGKAADMSEEFHSVPSTPLDAVRPPLHQGENTHTSIS